MWNLLDIICILSSYWPFMSLWGGCILTDKAAPGLLMTLCESQSSVSSRTDFYTVRRELLILSHKLWSMHWSWDLCLSFYHSLFFRSAWLIKGLSLRLWKGLAINFICSGPHKILSRRKWSLEVDLKKWNMTSDWTLNNFTKLFPSVLEKMKWVGSNFLDK